MQLFNFNFTDLNIAPGDAEEILGFVPGESPEPFSTILAEAMDAVPGLCDIKAGYKIIGTPVFDQVSKIIIVNGVTFNPGKIVYNQLKESSSLALFVASAGPGISNRICELTAMGDSLQSYVYDVIGSVVAQKTVDKMTDLLEIEINKQGLGITDPYSPGFCDWSVSEQQNLFTFFPERLCGVTLSASSLMSPIKSISGMIGINMSFQRKGYQCMMCTDVNCFVGQIIKTKKR